MKIGVLVLEGPYQHQAVDSAYHFIKAAQARGHEIVGVFLYTDGVNNANKFIKPPGERNISRRLDDLGFQFSAVTGLEGELQTRQEKEARQQSYDRIPILAIRHLYCQCRHLEESVRAYMESRYGV